MSDKPKFVVYSAGYQKHIILKHNGSIYNNYTYYAEAPDLFCADRIAQALTKLSENE